MGGVQGSWVRGCAASTCRRVPGSSCSCTQGSPPGGKDGEGSGVGVRKQVAQGGGGNRRRKHRQVRHTAAGRWGGPPRQRRHKQSSHSRQTLLPCTSKLLGARSSAAAQDASPGRFSAAATADGPAASLTGCAPAGPTAVLSASLSTCPRCPRGCGSQLPARRLQVGMGVGGEGGEATG